MGTETRRHMRLLVFFDLPVVSREDRRAYTIFRRFLINDGYDMIQFSVYVRILLNPASEHARYAAKQCAINPSGPYARIPANHLVAVGR